MYTFVWFSGAIWETPSKKTAVILSHLYVIGVKIVLREIRGGIEDNSKIIFFYFSTKAYIVNPNDRSQKMFL